MPAPKLRGRTKLPSALALALTCGGRSWPARPRRHRPQPPSSQSELVLLVGLARGDVGAERELGRVAARRPRGGRSPGSKRCCPSSATRPRTGSGGYRSGFPAVRTAVPVGSRNAERSPRSRAGTSSSTPPTRRVIVYQGGRPLRAFDAVVGKPSTPTPAGEFFVEEDVKLGASEVGAPYAIALSARSNVFQEFRRRPRPGRAPRAREHRRRARQRRLARLRAPRCRRHALAGYPRRPRRAGDDHPLSPPVRGTRITNYR